MGPTCTRFGVERSFPVCGAHLKEISLDREGSGDRKQKLEGFQGLTRNTEQH